jgi:hypothetical protein
MRHAQRESNNRRSETRHNGDKTMKAETQNMVYGWQTTKTQSGYVWSVYKFAYQVPTVTIKSGTLSSRSKAVAAAKKWMVYLKKTNG